MVNADYVWSCRRMHGIISMRDEFLHIMKCCDSADKKLYDEYSNLLGHIDRLIQLEAKCLAVPKSAKKQEI